MRGMETVDGPAKPLPAASAVERAAVSQQLGRLLAQDPLFSPLVELACERERKLGEGGMGVVWLVRDRRTGRRAALKLVKDEGQAGRARRFLREALITLQLDHPGIP